MKNEKLNDEQRIAIDIDKFFESDDEQNSDCVKVFVRGCQRP